MQSVLELLDVRPAVCVAEHAGEKKDVLDLCPRYFDEILQVL